MAATPPTPQKLMNWLSQWGDVAVVGGWGGEIVAFPFHFALALERISFYHSLVFHNIWSLGSLYRVDVRQGVLSVCGIDKHKFGLQKHA